MGGSSARAVLLLGLRYLFKVIVNEEAKIRFSQSLPLHQSSCPFFECHDTEFVDSVSSLALFETNWFV